MYAAAKFILRIGIIEITLILLLIQGCQDDSDGTNPNPSASYSQVDFEPSWSNQNVIAFAHSDPDFDDSGIFTVNSNGTNLTHLISGYAKSPCWSPDGMWLVFAMNDQLYKVNTQNDSLVLLTTSSRNAHPKWNSANRIFFIRCDGTDCGAYSVDNSGGQLTLIYSRASYINSFTSNSVLLLIPIRNESGSQTGDSLITFDFVNQIRTVIKVLNDSEHQINSYPVSLGTDIIFSSINSGGYSYIYKITTTGTNLSKLTITQSYSPDYSPANRIIIYTNRSPGNGRLWMMDENGGNNVQFTH